MRWRVSDPRVWQAIAVAIVWAAAAARAAEQPSRYLYIWMGDKAEKSSDFLAVMDVDPASRSYGQFVASEPVGFTGSMPHHLQYELPPKGEFMFANGHHLEKVLLFDFKQAKHPRLVRELPRVPPYRYPHDIVRLSDGHVLVGYLRSDGPSPSGSGDTLPANHGGIAEFDAQGRLLRSASADDGATKVPIRPYTFALLPKLDRMVTTSARMMERESADVVQVWRFSDFKLLHTLSMPPARLPSGKEMVTKGGEHGELIPTGHMIPFEPRVMPDGSVLLNAYGCGFYRVTELASAAPKITNVYTIEVPVDVRIGGCGVPAIVGRFWIMPVGEAHVVVTLDVSNPARPVEVSRLPAPGNFVPHWLSKDPGANRLILGQEMGHEDRMLMMRIDSRTGALSWDQSIRSPDGSLGINFNRTTWPHGATGPATGHSALFHP